MNIFILTGLINSGKTTYLKDILIPYVRTKGLDVAGFICECTNNYSQIENKEYQIVNLSNSKQMFFGGHKDFKNSIKYESFYFSKTALKEGSKIISSLKNKNIFAIIDEIGMLELTEHNDSYFKAIEELLKNPPSYLCVVIRETLLDKLLKKLFANLPVQIITIESRSLLEQGHINDKQ